MNKYKVTVIDTWVEAEEVIVEADTEDEAGELALELVQEGEGKPLDHFRECIVKDED